MQVKTVRAATLAKALDKVRAEVGMDAVVLQTRHVRRGGLLGLLGGTEVEVTAADGRAVARARAKKQRARVQPRKAAAAGRSALTSRPARASTTPQAAAPAPKVDAEGWYEPGATAALIRQTVAAVREDMRPEPEVRMVAPPASAETGRLSAEMREVKALLAKLVQKQASPDAACAEGVLADRYLAMVQQEVAEELAQKLVAQAREAESGSEDEVLRSALASVLPVAPEASVPTRTKGPRVIALVGPTGVGKTTTLAKLAARYRLTEGKRVVLATIDTYRIAAVDQLRTYAEILGLELEVIQRVEQVDRVLADHSDADVVLIDTAGRSPRDGARLTDLGRFLERAKPEETHLVLSATSSERTMRDVNLRFSVLEPTHVIFTKVDEAICFGGLINVLTDLGRPLSFITTGQEVPNDIEPGTAARLASLVLDDSGGSFSC